MVVEEIMTRRVLFFGNDVGIIAEHIDVDVDPGLLKSLGQ